MRRSKMLAFAIVFASVWIVMAAGTTAAWLTEEVRAVAVVMLPTAVVASLLVLYFDWREELRRRVLAARDGRADLCDGGVDLNDAA